MTTIQSQDTPQGLHRHSGACGDKDDGRCRDKGIEAQAKYISDHAAERQKVRESYDGARARYTTVRSGLKPTVAAIGLTLEDLLERTKCQLDDQDVVRVRRAYRRVVKRLKRCGKDVGCCIDDDDFGDRVRDCDPDDIPGLIAQLTRRTQEARACFEDLIKEASTGDEGAPTDAATTAVPAPTPATEAPTPTPPLTTGLASRVTALQTEVDKIKAAVAEGSGDPVTLYAQALVARRHHKHVWRGFADVNDYMDCLCETLMRYVHGHAAIVELTGRAAVDQCRRDSWTAACTALKADAPAEVVAEYLRVCREESGDDDAPPHDHGHDDADDGGEYGGGGPGDGYGRDVDHGGGHGGGKGGGHGGGKGGYGGGEEDKPPRAHHHQPDDGDTHVDMDDDERWHGSGGRRRRPRRPYEDADGDYQAP